MYVLYWNTRFNNQWEPFAYFAGSIHPTLKHENSDRFCTCIWSCIHLARILVFSGHVHSKGFPGFTDCSTMETLYSSTTDVLGLTVVLQVMFMNRAELAIKATPQAIRIPCQALLYQIIQPCSQEVRSGFISIKFIKLCAFWSCALTELS